MFSTVVAIDNKSLVTISLSATKLKLWSKLTNTTELRIVVDVLQKHVSVLVGNNRAKTYLKILSWNFNFIELGILEFNKPMTQQIQWLFSRTPIKEFLVSTTPVLKSLNILLKIRLRDDEVLFIVLLLKEALSKFT